MPDPAIQSLSGTFYVDVVAVATAPEGILMISHDDWTCSNYKKFVLKGGSPSTQKQANSQESE